MKKIEITYKAKIDSNKIFGDDSLSNEEIIEKCKEREVRNFGICAYLYYYPDYCSADNIAIPFRMELTEISIDEFPVKMNHKVESIIANE